MVQFTRRFGKQQRNLYHTDPHHRDLLLYGNDIVWRVPQHAGYSNGNGFACFTSADGAFGNRLHRQSGYSYSDSARRTVSMV